MKIRIFSKAEILIIRLRMIKDQHDDKASLLVILCLLANL